MELMTEWEVKGRIEERQELVLRLLTRKVGPLPEAVQSRVVALSPDTLLELSEALLAFSNLNDLTEWLERSVQTLER